MITDTTMPPAETDTETETELTLLVVALERLFEHDKRWRPVPSVDGATITLMRCWQDTTADTIAMHPAGAYAVRTDADGLDVDHVTGTAAAVVSAVGDWLAPERTDWVSALSGVRP